MKIIIEVAGGRVTGAFYRSQPRDPKPIVVPEVAVMELDGLKAGEGTIRHIFPEPLMKANEITRAVLFAARPPRPKPRPRPRRVAKFDFQ